MTALWGGGGEGGGGGVREGRGCKGGMKDNTQFPLSVHNL